MPNIRQVVQIAFVTTLVLSAGCAGTGINKGDFSIISIDEEWALGDSLSRDIAKEMRLLDDPSVNAYVDRIGQMLLLQARNDTPVASKPWHFHVVDDKEVNAFNIPGGHVYVNSGLVSKADRYDELVLIMAHEVSHGLARHGVENLSKQYGIAVLASLVLGNNPSVYKEILANILAGGAIMRFSRDAEREADQLGIRYGYAAGVDPEGMVSFFRKLLELRQSQPGVLDQFFSSHPLTEDRIRDAEAEIAQLPPKTLQATDPGFADFQKRVAAAATP